jgi:hypothetical protein
MSGKQKTVARNLGQKTEKRIIKKIGGRQQPASGAIPGIPNDGIKGRYLIEVKSTINYSLGLKRKWLEELDENAILRGKKAAMIIVYNNSMRSLQGSQEWVAVPLNDFKLLTNGWKK